MKYFIDFEAAALWLKENKCESDTYEHFNLENTIKTSRKLSRVVTTTMEWVGGE